MKRIEIENLYRIEESEREKLIQMLLRAFVKYPKLGGAFPDFDTRQKAIEMVVRYYLAYDMKYGSAYSLDEKIQEAVVMVHSDEMGFEEEKVEAACCENEGYLAARAALTEEEQKSWDDFFEEFDRQERRILFPEEYIYLDFLGVEPAHQGEGRGRRLMEAVMEKGKELHLPLMLFTNGQEDVEFYEHLGFYVLAEAAAEEFGMHNVYMLYEING